jgi:glutamate N-acetyltransferase / amino-acid N-acetyltransferase
MKSEEYDSINAYEADLAKRAVIPGGFTAATTSLSFIPGEKPVKNPLPMNISLILGEKDITSFGALFTRNSFPGAPIVIGKKRLTESILRGILINNKVANVCAPNGVEDAEAILTSLAEHLNLPASSLLPASTGIIGWQLPVTDIKEALPRLVEGLGTDTLLKVAKGIMTTDSFPKIRTVMAGDGRITAIAKGAGMIEPNMATMLVFILTDIDIPRDQLQACLTKAAKQSFNTISVDGDQSTSDMAVILSSSTIPCPSINDFEKALISVCKDLAEDIVRNGEGTSHVIKVTIKGSCSEELATGVGKAVINSPLVKTAIFGNDPNVGRIIGAIGDFLGNHHIDINTQHITITLGEIEIFTQGAFTIDNEKEIKLSHYLKNAQLNPEIKGFPEHNKTVDITIRIGEGTGSYTVIGSDLTYEYVRENADYRS